MSARAGALLLVVVVAVAGSTVAADRPELELGVESLSYETTETRLNRGNVLGLADTEELLRATFDGKQALGDARAVFRGYVQRTIGGAAASTDWTVRQAYLQYGWGSGLQLRIGKQRIAWGSGFAWNPTNRVEPAKNPLNTSLEQEGAWAARMDWVPAPWAGVILVAARSDTEPGDLPFAAPAQTRRTAALRARFLVKDTDVAAVFSGGKGQRTLLGLDVGRSVGGTLTAHVEAALYRGAELQPPRDDRSYTRVVAGVLQTRGDDALSLEYFYNGEGYTSAAADVYLATLDATSARALDPSLPPAARAQAASAYAAAAVVPYGGGLGLRRHYLQAAWTRTWSGGKWSLSARGTAGLADGGVAFTPGASYAPRGDVTLNLDAIVPLGPAASEYRLAPLRAAVQARARVIF